MSVAEALETLEDADLARMQRMGSAECDEAVALLCRDFSAGEFDPEDTTRRASAALRVYAAKFLTKAAKEEDALALRHGVICLHVSNVAAMEPREATAMVDRYIVLAGSVKADAALVDTAVRLRVSRGLVELIQKRVTRSKAG